MLSIFDRAGGTPLSALHLYFPECSALASSNLKDPLPSTTGSDTPPRVVSVLPLKFQSLAYI